MPLTPFHLGFTLLFGTILSRYVNITAVLLASVLIDVRTIYCFFFSDCQLHGILHTYIGATVFAIGIIVIVYLLKNKLHIITSSLNLYQSYSIRSIIFGAIVGSWSHVFFDSFMHGDITPLYPILENPFLDLIDNSTNYILASVFFVIGLAVLCYKYNSKNRD